jgi:hypothetical protein
VNVAGQGREGPAPRGLLSVVAVAGTCLLASAGYSGAITMTALLFGLVPGLLLAGAAAAAVGRLATPRAAAIAGIGVALAAAEVVNLVAGQGNGPAARSTFAAAGFTALAVAAAGSPYPPLFLAPLCGVVFGALSLGAGAEVQAVTVVTALAAVCALGVIEGQRRRWSGPPTGRLAVVALALLAGAAAAVLWQTVDHRIDRVPAVLSSTSVDADIKPPVIFGGETKPTARPPHPDDRESPSVPTSRPHEVAVGGATGMSLLDRASRGFLALLVAGLLLLVLRRLWVLVAWRLLRRRLRRTSPGLAVAGAWVWAGRRLRLYDVSFAPSLSPDQVALGGAVNDVPRRVSRPLEELAGRVTVTTFAGGPDPAGADVAEAWHLADRAGKGARRSLSPAGLVRAWFRAPTARSTV